jgi:hypothetical protein
MPIKLMAVSRRRSGLTRAEYFQRMERYLAGLVCEEDSKIAMCVENQVLDGAFGTPADSSRHEVTERDGVIEIFFNNFRDMMFTLNPAKKQQVELNGKSFTDEPSNLVMLAEEEEISVENAQPNFPGRCDFVHAAGVFKVIQYIRRDEEVFPEDFYRRWRRAHQAAFDRSSFAQERMRRVVASRRSRISDNEEAARKLYGLPEMPVYDLAVSMWFDTAEDAGAFRQYNKALHGTTTRFADWSQSFFLYTRSVPILLPTMRNDEFTGVAKG